jgi:phage/plasmid-associated DNA primase
MIPLDLNLKRNKFYTKSLEGSIFPITPLLCSELLTKHSDLKHMRIFKDSSCCYVYDKSLGIYVKFSLDYLKTIIRKLLEETNMEKIYSYYYVTKVFNNLSIGPLSFPGSPSFDKGFIVFQNGTLHIPSRSFSSHSPDHFLNTSLPFIYDPNATSPLFNSFLLEVSSGHFDRVNFLKSWLNVIVFQKIFFQVFFVIVGPGASGKSTLAALATALAGKEGTITTSLRSLHHDPFELTNLSGKKLILLSDSERYQGDLQIIKQIVGCDSLQGRTKFIQGSQEVIPEGIVTVVSNSPLSSKDNSNALTRRMRSFSTEKIFIERVPFLIFKDGSWVGVLSGELPGIFNEVYNMDEDTVYQNIVHMAQTVKSLEVLQIDQNQYINHLLHWVQEEVTLGPGAYIGYKPMKNYRNLLDDTSRRNLYPAYISWCERKNIPFDNHQRFTYDIVLTLTQEGYVCEKIRKSKGMYITGVTLKDEICDRDYLLGSQTELETELYKEYMKILETSELKETLNKAIKGSLSEEIAIKLTNELTKETKINSEKFYGKMFSQFKRGIDIINNHGIVPYSYKSLGVSPRIIPTNYGKSINGVKRNLREYAYGLAVEKCGLEVELIDVDLKSCYTSILLGLYPHYLSKIQKVIEKEGLWKYIEGEFKKRGKSEYFNKDSVKICTYSSFFQGGNRAMMEGILDNNRRNLGLTPSEFKESSFYEEYHEKARGVVGEMQNSDIVLTMRELSTQIKEEFLGKEMKGPTGHTYMVTEETFKTAYPNYLQSYEFSLISKSVLGTIERYKMVELIGHYHDGVVLAVPAEKREIILETLQNELNKVRLNFKLSYKLEFELKAVYRVKPVM